MRLVDFSSHLYFLRSALGWVFSRGPYGPSALPCPRLPKWSGAYFLTAGDLGKAASGPNRPMEISRLCRVNNNLILGFFLFLFFSGVDTRAWWAV
jgi:hypothetical protein